MSTLFFDSSNDRWKEVKSLLPRGAKRSKKSDDCIGQFHLDWSLLFIGDGEDCMQVVDHIVEHEPIILQIIIHSSDPDNAKAMLNKLRKARYQTISIPFPALIEKLRNNI